jgi:hypothetical protein
LKLLSEGMKLLCEGKPMLSLGALQVNRENAMLINRDSFSRPGVLIHAEEAFWSSFFLAFFPTAANVLQGG